MRILSTATLAAAVALVFASAAQSATQSSSVIPSMQGAPTLVGTTPSPSSTTSSGTSTSANTVAMQRAPSTNVDVRAQQTNAAVASTHASGSTSATTGLVGTSTTATTSTGTTSGLALGTGNVFLNNPADFTNGAVAANQLGTVYAANDVMGGSSVMEMDNATIASAARPNGASVDRAIREVSRDRQRIGRNGQLLYTIAPRTNVDRSAQMRDDPLPFSLTGSNSTLTR